MPQMTIFEWQKGKNMTRVKNKVINVKVVLEFTYPQRQTCSGSGCMENHRTPQVCSFGTGS
jgi:hypothetical protein